MRSIALAAMIVAAVVPAASAQPAARFEIGPVLRLDRISLEGGAGGRTSIAGAAATYHFSRTYGVEAEVTQASGTIARSYDGWFVSYATDPNATREEIERLAPVARRSLGYTPGIGWSAAFIARGAINPRISIGARAGVSARAYDETSTYAILSIPEGIDAARVAGDFQNASYHRVRSGLLLGLDSALDLTSHLRVIPEARYVYGGPARIGDKYREVGLGVRAVWRF